MKLPIDMGILRLSTTPLESDSIIEIGRPNLFATTNPSFTTRSSATYGEKVPSMVTEYLLIFYVEFFSS
ncbi:hypothetical protein Sjap_021719 [Stephania japonica]|uniref:Uncharacterized protein n=1 Tax=Stephania japonica TaxID=461633 RepID=A0AAP0HT32_9MAGN